MSFPTPEQGISAASPGQQLPNVEGRWGRFDTSDNLVVRGMPACSVRRCPTRHPVTELHRADPWSETSSDDEDCQTNRCQRRNQPWIPNGKMIERANPLPIVTAERPLAVPTTASNDGGKSDRTVPELEQALREWLKSNRCIHESRRLTMIRSLVAVADIEKTAAGVPTQIRSPENVRRAYAYTRRLNAHEYFRQSLRKSAFDFPECKPLVDAKEACEASRDASGDYMNLSEAERWACKQQVAIELASASRGYDFTCGGKELRHPFMGQLPDKWKAPCAKRANTQTELAQERKIAREKEDGCKNSPERLGCCGIELDAYQLMTAWNFLITKSEGDGCCSPLAPRLTPLEARNLMDAHGRYEHKSGPEFRSSFENEVHLRAGAAARKASSVGSYVMIMDKLIERIVEEPSHALSNKAVLKSVPDAGIIEDQKIVAWPCRTSFHSPSEFDFGAAAKASLCGPNAELELEHVHGYGGLRNTAPNLFYVRGGRFVYYTAALGVVCALDSEDTLPERKESEDRQMESRDDFSEVMMGGEPAEESVDVLGLTPKAPCNFQHRHFEDSSDPIRENAGLPVASDASSDGQNDRVSSNGFGGSQRNPRCGGWISKSLERRGKESQRENRCYPRQHLEVCSQREDYYKTQSIVIPGPDAEEGNVQIGTNVSKTTMDLKCARVAEAVTESPSQQAFFQGHDDDIQCLALHPGKELIASGQVGFRPYVCVWRACENCPEVGRIRMEEGSRGIAALAFSGGTGRYLTIVTMDNAHTVTVYDWGKGARISQGPGYKGVPPQVFGCTWERFSKRGEKHFLTFGIRHVKLWTECDEENRRYKGSMACWSGKNPTDTLCATFLPPCFGVCLDSSAATPPNHIPQNEGCMFITGHPNGDVHFWRGRRAVCKITAHPLIPMTGRESRRKSLESQGDPMGLAMSHWGVRCVSAICGKAQGRCPWANVDPPVEDWLIVTGGGDGTIRFWKRTHKKRMEADGPLSVVFEVTLPADTDDLPQAVGAFDVNIGKSRMVVGTRECDVWDIPLPTQFQKEAAETFSCRPFNRVVSGHASDLYAVATHPQNGHVYATACCSSQVQIWHAPKRHRIGKAITAGGPVSSIAFSEPDGRHLALGLVNGGVEVYDRDRARVSADHRCRREIRDIKYTPDGRIMAVGGQDMLIDLYSVHSEYAHYARCCGHSATVLHLDFSSDSRVLQSSCNAYEILHWDVATGRRLVQCQRDRNWHTWTSKVGFPVMGIWPEGADGTDINSVCRSPMSRDFLVAADDFGNVRLYNYPCVVNTPGCQVNGGHSAHVMMVRFTCDDARVISVGGRDRAVCQWRLHRRNVQPPDQPFPWDADESGIGQRQIANQHNVRLSMVSSSMSRSNGSMPQIRGSGTRKCLFGQQSACMAEASKVENLRGVVGRRGCEPITKPFGNRWGPIDSRGVRYGWVEGADINVE